MNKKRYKLNVGNTLLAVIALLSMVFVIYTMACVADINRCNQPGSEHYQQFKSWNYMAQDSR